jgi:hypothetical protein
LQELVRPGKADWHITRRWLYQYDAHQYFQVDEAAVLRTFDSASNRTSIAYTFQPARHHSKLTSVVERFPDVLCTQSDNVLGRRGAKMCIVTPARRGRFKSAALEATTTNDASQQASYWREHVTLMQVSSPSGDMASTGCSRAAGTTFLNCTAPDSNQSSTLCLTATKGWYESIV